MRNEVLDERTDVYGLVATIYAVLSGARLFEGMSGYESYQAHATQEPLMDVEPSEPMTKPLLSLLREATAMDRGRRPGVTAFEQQFVDAVMG